MQQHRSKVDPIQIGIGVEKDEILFSLKWDKFAKSLFVLRKCVLRVFDVDAVYVALIRQVKIEGQWKCYDVVLRPVCLLKMIVLIRWNRRISCVSERVEFSKSCVKRCCRSSKICCKRCCKRCCSRCAKRCRNLSTRCVSGGLAGGLEGVFFSSQQSVVFFATKRSFLRNKA